MITIEWVADEGAYIVRQDGEFIGDFESLESAGQFAIAVADNPLSCNTGHDVVLVAVKG